MGTNIAPTIIRTIPRGPSGSIGHSPIPKWTNDYFLSFVDADGNQIGPAPRNLIGPQGPSGASQFFRTNAQVEASVIGSSIDSIVVSRRGAGLPFVPTNYVRMTSEPIHLGKIRSADRFLPDGTIDPVNGGWWAIAEAIVDIRMLGATSGATIDAEMAAAVAVAASIGSALGIPNGFYRFLKQVNLSAMLGSSIIIGGSVRFDFTSATNAADFPDGGFVYMSGGALVRLPDLAANVGKGASSALFQSSPGLASGDRICIWNPQDGSFSPFNANYRAGEFRTVSDGTGGAAVKFYGTLFADYNAADVYVYKHPNKTISITGGAITIIESRDVALKNVAGFKAEYVVDSDLSAFRPTQSRYAGVALKQCVGLFGMGYQCKMIFPAGGDTCYALIYANCQNINIEGEFNGGRHGVSGGGYSDAGSIPNRHVHIAGTFRNSPEALPGIGAVEFHGNCEFCSYSGLIEGGVTLGGNHNSVSGDISTRPTQNGLAIYFGEMLGASFKIEGTISVTSAAVGTPVINIGDLGTTPLTALTRFGGVLDFSSVVFDCPFNSRLLSAQNSGANPVDPMIIDIRGAKWLRSATVPTHSVLISKTSGKDFDLLLMDGFVNGPNAPYAIADQTKVRGWRQRVSGTLAPSTSASVATVAVPINAPKRPDLSPANPLTTMGGTRAYPIVDLANTSATLATFGVTTVDGAAFPSSAGGTVAFMAAVDE